MRGAHTHKILAGLGLACLAAGSAPAAVLPDASSPVYYQYTVVGGDDVSIGKSAEIEGNVHSNDDVDMKKDAVVSGNVSATDRVKNRGTIGGSVLKGAPPLDLPVPFDESTARSLADRVIEGDIKFTTDQVVDDVLFVPFSGGSLEFGLIGLAARADGRLATYRSFSTELATIDPETGEVQGRGFVPGTGIADLAYRQPLPSDHTTTVVGLVIDEEFELPVPDVQVQVLGSRVAVTGADGTLTLRNVPAVFGPLVGRIIEPSDLLGESAPTPPVAGGTTDLGTIIAVPGGV